MAIAGVFFFCQSADSKKTADSTTPQTKDTVLAAKTSDTRKGVSEASETKQERKLVVYYFHGNFRCHSCITIENLTKQAVNSGFTDQLKNGRIEMKVINIEEPGNEHFADDYKLYTKSVILSDIKNGSEASWKNLEKVWTLLGDEDKFIEYIQTEMKTLL